MGSQQQQAGRMDWVAGRQARTGQSHAPSAATLLLPAARSCCICREAKGCTHRPLLGTVRSFQMVTSATAQLLSNMAIGALWSCVPAASQQPCQVWAATQEGAWRGANQPRPRVWEYGMAGSGGSGGADGGRPAASSSSDAAAVRQACGLHPAGPGPDLASTAWRGRVGRQGGRPPHRLPALGGEGAQVADSWRPQLQQLQWRQGGIRLQAGSRELE